jgi:outer membrane protein assembly factor BamB
MGGDVPDRGAIVALAVEDGTERWRWNGDGPSVGASPVIHDLEDQPHLVFKTEEYIVSLDPRSGEELWRIPFEVPTGNTIVTPLLIGDRLFNSDDQAGFHAWQIRRKGETWEVEQRYRHRQVSMYTSSPVLVSEQIVGFSQFRKGQLFGLDPQSGRVLWRGDGRWGEHASLIAWGDQILTFKEDGTLVIGNVGPTGLEVLRRYRVGSSPMWSHPAIARGRILVRHGDRLTAYGWEAEAEQ